jgi:hypothetical protein
MCEPLPDPSVGGHRKMEAAPFNETCRLGGRVRMVIRAPVALGVASQAQVEAQTHVGTSIRAGTGHGR